MKKFYEGEIHFKDLRDGSIIVLFQIIDTVVYQRWLNGRLIHGEALYQGWSPEDLDELFAKEVQSYKKDPNYIEV